MDDEETFGSRREEILQAAENLFAERGYRETGLYEVAERLGFRRQAIYHYFKSKDDILLELIRRASSALEASAEPTFKSDLPPQDKLTELVRNHVHQVLRHAAVFRIQFEELDRISDPRGKALRQDRAAYVRRFASVISEGQATGAFVDTPHRTLALLIIGMCNWTTEWYGQGTRIGIDEIAEHAARVAVHGASATSAASRRQRKPTVRQTPPSSRSTKRAAKTADATQQAAKTGAATRKATAAAGTNKRATKTAGIAKKATKTATTARPRKNPAKASRGS